MNRLVIITWDGSLGNLLLDYAFDQMDRGADVVDEELTLAVGQVVVDLASVADCVIDVVDCTRAFALVVNVLSDVSYSIEGFVATMTVLLAVLEIPLVNPKMVLERSFVLYSSTFAVKFVRMVETTVILIHPIRSLPVQSTPRPRSILIIALISMSLACLHPEPMEDIIPEPAYILQLLGFILPLNTLTSLCLIVVELAMIIRPIREDKSTIAVGFPLFEVANEETSVLFVHCA